MSDLDEQLLIFIQDEKLSSNEKCEKVKKLFAIDRSWQELKADPKFRLNRGHSLSICVRNMSGGESSIKVNAVSLAVIQADLDLLKLLIDNGYDPSQALFVCVYQNDPKKSELVQYLLAHGAKLREELPVNTYYKNTYAYAESIGSSFLAMLKAKEAMNCSEELFQEAKPSSPHHYASCFSQFALACSEDVVVVIRSLAIQLQEIALRKKTEKDLPCLPFFTRELSRILKHPGMPDEINYQLFQEVLHAEWLGYEMKEDGFFKTDKEFDKFCVEIFKDNPKGRFQNGGKDVSEPEAKHQPVIKPHFLARCGSPLHQKTILPEVKRLESKEITYPNYFEIFLNLPIAKQTEMIKTYRQKFEGFNAFIIDSSVTHMARSFGIESFQGCLAGPEQQQNEWNLEDYLNMPLGEEVRYTFFSLVTTNAASLHAVAVVIDKLKKSIFCVDPEMNRYGAQSEAERRLNQAIHALERLEGFKIILPNVASHAPQLPSDFYNCGIFAAIIIVAILLKQEKKLAHSTDPRVDTVLATLEIDFDQGVLPQSRFINEYLGALLCAHQHYLEIAADDPKKATAKISKLFAGV